MGRPAPAYVLLRDTRDRQHGCGHGRTQAGTNRKPKPLGDQEVMRELAWEDAALLSTSVHVTFLWGKCITGRGTR
jgi:hypothetical protein